MYRLRFATKNSPTMSYRNFCPVDYAIFVHIAQKIGFNVGCVARSAVLLKPYIVKGILSKK